MIASAQPRTQQLKSNSEAHSFQVSRADLLVGSCADGGDMTSGPEWERVERPLLEQLLSLGWETLVWSKRQPDHRVSRSSDRDVLLEKRLQIGAVDQQPGTGRSRMA